MNSAYKPPPGAWDCHAHVLGPYDTYSLDEARGYTPAPYPAQAYASMLRALGLDHGVLVQPSVYGTDNRLLVDTLAQYGSGCRGVAVLAGSANRSTVLALHEAGVRGFRLNLLFPGGPGLATLERTARLVADLGWHAQLLIDIRMLEDIETRLDALPIVTVFDHMGHFPHGLGTEWPGFQRLLRRLSAGRTYVKLSASYRLAAGPTHLQDTAKIAQALVSRAPGQLVWGSDWPHVGIDGEPPCTGSLLDGLHAWCADPAVLQQVLVSTPRRLYF
jgi:predicted TIM-barrel fold metal-dependent hydrolase